MQKSATVKGFLFRMLDIMGVTVTVREALDMDLDGLTRQELLRLQEDLYEKRTALYFEEPIGESTNAYAQWDDRLFTLQDQICQVEEALECAADDPLEEPQVRVAPKLPVWWAAVM